MRKAFALSLLILLHLGCANEDRPFVVFAAASTASALDEIVELYRAATAEDVRTSYASSGALARQIEGGAPASIFLSASTQWFDYLAERGYLLADTRIDLLANSLVLVAPSWDNRRLAAEDGMPIVERLGESRLAMGDPSHVPAGQYAKQALEKLGAWAAVEARTALAENVRSALLLVGRGEASLGIVYATDAAVEPAVRVVGRFPADTHDPIRYPAALVSKGNTEQARAFLAYLDTPPARAVFKKYGFETP